MTPGDLHNSGDVSRSNPRDLAALLERESEAADVSRAWMPQELAAVLRHQLTTPLLLDLGAPLVALSDRLEGEGAFYGLSRHTFEGLLHHPHPPAEALERVKQFAKAGRTRPDGLLPPAVATVLYFASIVVARRRCAASISGLDDAAVRDGSAWALAQDWVDEPTKSLFRDDPGGRT